MYHVYGNYQHTANEVNLISFNQATKYSGRGRIESTVKTATLEVTLIASTQSAIKTAIDDLEDAYSVDGLDWALYHDDGTRSPHSLSSSSSIGGVRVMRLDWNKSDGAEYATQRTATIVLEAEYAGGSNLLMFAETLRFSGNGGRRERWIETANGPPQKQTISQRTIARATQSGQAIGLLVEPSPPPPIWPNLEMYDLRDITRTSPQFDGRVFRNWAIAWSYQFESGQPLYGEPHRA